MLIEHHSVTCPHCWEPVELTFDVSVPEQRYVEDCAVCCRPMVVSYTAAEGRLLDVNVWRDDDV